MKPNKTVISIYFLASAAGLLLAALLSAWGGGASEKSLLFGLSTQRLILVGGTLIPFVGLIYLGLRAGRQDNFIRPSGWLTAALALVFALAWYFTWTPAEYFEKYYYYLNRIQPLILWLTCASGAGLALLLTLRFGLHPKTLRDHLRGQKSALLLAAALMVVFILVAFAATRLVTGVTPAQEDFWYGASVPVLSFQVLAALLAGGAFHLLEARFPKIFARVRIDLLLFILIWLAAAFLWASEPVRKSFMVSMPVGPNSEFYPFADAMIYDISSQFALIGQGINNNSLYDRPLYSALLIAFHSLGGQNYERVAAIQAAFFAVLPALIYLLGKFLRSRSAGFVAAILVLLRGANGLAAATWIDTSTSKQFLTELPTAIGLVIATLLVMHWLKEPQRNWKYALWAGGTLGLTALARPHVFAIALILLATAFIISFPNWKRSILLPLAVSLTLLAGILPWYQYNSPDMSLAERFLLQIRTVVSKRYTPAPLPTPQGDLLSPPKVANIQPIVFQRTLIEFASAHFTHNLVMSVLGLPAGLTNYKLEATVKDTENYWEAYWDGRLSPSARGFVVFNLVLIALGLGYAFKRQRWSGIAPLIVFLAYHSINALARTSGGRYLVPVDWVVLLYYVLGWVALADGLTALFGRRIRSLNGDPAPGQDSKSLWRILAQSAAIILAFALLGALIPLASSAYPARYQETSKKQLVELIKRDGYAAQIGAGRLVNLPAFLRQKNSRVLVGRILYPRHYDMNKGESLSIDALMVRGYPRMVFSLIGPAGQRFVVLPGALPATFPHASDGIVLGCLEKDTLQALAVILLKEQIVYTRAPLSKLTCPMPEPVCNNNRKCR